MLYVHFLLNNSYLFFLPLVVALIEHEAKHGIPVSRIMLGGFSQVIPCVLFLKSNIFDAIDEELFVKNDRSLFVCFRLRVGLCLCIPP